MSTKILNTVYIYLYTDRNEQDRRGRMRDMLVGDERGPLVECKVVYIQRGTQYPAVEGTLPQIGSGRGWSLIPLFYSNGRTDRYIHNPGLVVALGGIIDGCKAKDLSWPNVVLDSNTQVALAEVLDSGLVQLTLEENHCVAIAVDEEMRMTWEDCLQEYGKPARAHP